MSSVKKETTLVRLAKHGDADAFGELYAGIALDLYRFALYQTGDPVRAQDAVSDAVLLAFEHMVQLKNADAFRAWMFSILKNCCRDQQKEKAAAMQNLSLEVLNAEPAAATDVADGMDLRAALQTLGDVDREIVLLSYVGGYNSSEIGEMMHFKAGAVRTRLARAREKLKNLLSTEEMSCVRKNQ